MSFFLFLLCFSDIEQEFSNFEYLCFFIKIKYVNLSQNLVVEKEMKIAVERLSWKEMFDKTEQNRKIGYDVMYCEDIEILKNDYKRYTMEYFVDIFFESGEFCFELNAEKYHLTSPTALVFQPDSEFRFVSCDNPVIYILIVSKNVRG